MLSLCCTLCHITLNVVGHDDEIDYLVGEQSEYWPDNYTCSCGYRLTKGQDPGSTVYDLSPVELFHFLSGLGLPEEQECTRGNVERVFRKEVKKVHGYELSGAKTFCVEVLELVDGTKVHLGASPKGAVIYRITPPPNNTGKCTDE